MYCFGDYLEKSRFLVSDFREIPRVYVFSFEKMHFRLHGDDPLSARPSSRRPMLRSGTWGLRTTVSKSARTSSATWR